MKKKSIAEEHPFPHKELEFIRKLNIDKTVPFEDISVLLDLVHKYLDLRAELFYEFRRETRDSL